MSYDALMSGGAHLPGGEQRKASQRRSRRAMVMSSGATPMPTQTLQRGDRVRWSRSTGTVERLIGDVADIRQDGTDALWRLPVAELTRVPPSTR
jgi:hypothetical protein